MNKDIVKYENVLVIGNGFDLNLGLETSYSDYLSSKYFKYLLGTNTLARYLESRKKESKWVDIEKELYQYSISLFHKGENGLRPNPEDINLISSLRKDYYRICSSLRQYPVS